jgi:lysophospholipase L1-like esterase
MIFLLMFALIFAGMGNAAFAAKPVKAPTIRVVEAQPLIVSAGETTVSTNLVVRDHDEEDPEVTLISDGAASVVYVSERSNSFTYQLTYEKPIPYGGSGDEYVTVAVVNSVGTLTEETIHIRIEDDTPPPVNEPPVNNAIPQIDGTLETGTEAIPIYGTWTDTDSASFTVVRTWILNGTELTTVSGDDNLMLDPAWAGKTLALQEVATDSDGDSSTASSLEHTIKAPDNQPPVIGDDPQIGGTLVTGTEAIPIYGTWTDTDSASFTVVRTWILDGTELTTVSGDDNLMLDPAWAGKTLALQEVATDSDGASSTASSLEHTIEAPANQPPVNNAIPQIGGTLETGTEAIPIYGDWSDPDSASFTVVRTWILDGIEVTTVSGDDNLLLDPTWAGKMLVLKEVATDSDGASSTVSSLEHMIKAPVTTETLVYVALGDSIATGTVAPSLDNEIPYIHAFRTYLENETGRNVELRDHSDDGDRSGHLLARLGGPTYEGVGADQALIDDVKQGEVITISIGGNNLMYSAKYTTYVFFGLIKVDYYDFDRINTDKAEAGRAAFEAEMPQIIQMIKGYNPNAKIILNDIYNPFNKTTDADNYNLVQSFFYRTDRGGVNDVIEDVCAANSGVERARVYETFENYGGGDGKEQITYMYITDLYWGFELRNPHPNSVGQGMIETAVENAYQLLP